MDDIATEITASLPVSGDKAMTGALDLGSQKITSLANATADTDALNRVTADGRYAAFPTYTAKTFSDTPYSQVAADKGDVITWDTSGGAVTHNLLAASSAGAGFTQYIIKITNDTNAVTIDGATTETINGATTITLQYQWESVMLVCDGSNWHIVSGSPKAISGAPKIDDAAVEGTWTVNAGTWTLPAFTTGGVITLGANITGADNEISGVYLKDTAEVTNALGTVGASPDINIASGNVVTATVAATAPTFTFSGEVASDDASYFTLILTNGAASIVTWPTSVDWAGGSSPNLQASGVDILEFLTVDGGTTWYGFAAGLDMQ
jgi:hypothetical protein